MASVTSAAEGTLQNIGFYVKEENDVITVDVRKIVRDKYAVVYVKNRDIANFTFRCANKAYTELYDASYFDEGHNWIYFDDSFDNPLSFNMNGQELYSDDIKVFQNNEKVTVNGYEFSVPVKHNDIIKIFLGETDTEFFTVNWTVEGNPEFGVMLDEIKVLTPADLTAAPSQELPGTKYTIHPADPTKPFVVTVNSEPVEKVAGDDYYESYSIRQPTSRFPTPNPPSQASRPTLTPAPPTSTTSRASVFSPLPLRKRSTPSPPVSTSKKARKSW